MDKQIRENNRLIAEFMGMTVYTNFNDPIRELMSGNVSHISTLGYHHSWDLLMPVVQAIDYTNLGYIEIQSKNLVSVSFGKTTKMYFNDTLLLNTYFACLAFIQWYNENK